MFPDYLDGLAKLAHAALQPGGRFDDDDPVRRTPQGDIGGRIPRIGKTVAAVRPDPIGDRLEFPCPLEIDPRMGSEDGVEQPQIGRDPRCHALVGRRRQHHRIPSAPGLRDQPLGLRADRPTRPGIEGGSRHVPLAGGPPRGEPDEHLRNHPGPAEEQPRQALTEHVGGQQGAVEIPDADCFCIKAWRMGFAHGSEV